MTIAAQAGEKVFNIPSATDAQVAAVQEVRQSMARVLDGMAGGAGCSGGLTTFFAAAEQFQTLWNQKISVFGMLLASGLPQQLRYIATDGISKDGKWGIQMRTCCASLEAWAGLGIAAPPEPACNVGLWLAAYPEAPDELRVRVVNSFGTETPATPQTPTPDGPIVPAQPAQVTFQQDQQVLGTTRRAGMPVWAWLGIGAVAVGGSYFLWRRFA